MAQPYIGEIRMFAGNYAPVGWLFCNGQLRGVSVDPDLFGVLGIVYGGNGTSNFALPDMRGRVPLHQGSGFGLGARAGTELVTLTSSQIPSHSHAMIGSNAQATSNNPSGNVAASAPSGGIASAYRDAGTNLVNLDPSSVAPVGGSQPHENTQPFLVVSFIISRFGLSPT